ncbi:DUF1513 domain-containing protein [Acuticoccus sp. M5D2P5]|uniref:DUF1513 domain-containing protein n=1 Tax=Acuticoccus kalidii TaxID=2910977 RepID=UPI001F344CBF|nr:DUF1513 domain-containing protein [Acuticoccus kalidii]MCF3933518.1 DUF1513 domain-containing protein [Acuticoccus kalidii]
MQLSRRSLLIGAGAGASGILSIPLLPGRAMAEAAPAFVAACQRAGGDFAAAVLDASGRILFTEELDGRGHDATVAPDGSTAVFFARRPGRFALVLDILNRRKATSFAPPENRRFAGHGFYSSDGKLLIATENDFDGERGILGIYDATDGYRRIGEFASRGIGPHEAMLLSDGRTIAVANGGILTHPDFPRHKLNLATMAPSLALVDIETGDLIEEATLPQNQHRLSIRHLAQSDAHTIWFGCQYEGPKTDQIPVVGRYRRGEGIALVAAPDLVYARMNHYVGSIAASRDGDIVAATSPRGGQIMVWDAKSLSFLRAADVADVAGATADHDAFAFSAGTGDILTAEAEPAHANVHWDNHLRRIRPA